MLDPEKAYTEDELKKASVADLIALRLAIGSKQAIIAAILRLQSSRGRSVGAK